MKRKAVKFYLESIISLEVNYQKMMHYGNFFTINGVTLQKICAEQSAYIDGQRDMLKKIYGEDFYYYNVYNKVIEVKQKVEKDMKKHFLIKRMD